MRIVVDTRTKPYRMVCLKRRGKSGMVPVGACPLPARGDDVGIAATVAYIESVQRLAPGQKLAEMPTEVETS